MESPEGELQPMEKGTELPRETQMIDGMVQVHYICWENVPKTDHIKILQCIPIGELVSTLPFEISEGIRCFRVPLLHSVSVSAVVDDRDLSHIHPMDMDCEILEFLKESYYEPHFVNHEGGYSREQGWKRIL